MSLHECPRCGKEIGTNSTSAGAFEIPPTLCCIHGDEAVEMVVADEAEIREGAIVNE